MIDHPIAPEIRLPDGSRLTSVKQATDFLRSAVDERSFDPWKEMVRRFESVRSEEDAIEAAGALRELLQVEGMMAPDKGRQHARNRVNDFPIEPVLRIRGAPDRIIRTTEEAALLVRELLTQHPRPDWEGVLREFERVRTKQDADAAAETLWRLLKAEHLLAA